MESVKKYIYLLNLLQRHYSLKTRYNFNAVLKYGEDFHSEHLIIKYLKRRVNGDRDTTFEIPQFGIIVSTKFHKNAVVKNQTRRLISKAIRVSLNKFPSGYYFVFIPKKNLLNSSGKIYLNVEDISTEIDSFLSKMDFT